MRQLSRAALLVFILTPSNLQSSDLTRDLHYRQQITSLNNISQSINNLAYQNSINSIASNFAIAMAGAQIANAQAAQTAEQGRWNQWNGLVSLLNEEQKQTVLNFNTTPDSMLVHLWKDARNNKTRFPMNG